ncbi:low molecular weight protein-tyrosine-phosphatase [Thalassotalea mangrovi]|uniref:Low molecular weight phosphotyrosine protein phosphatase n=1 Tax=Thalassotalea mangrovi TaxID=2572245 RepID=A0A4U1B2X1_9GAMM|nr:low molecular weight protein-tyrosine-phosphatase [Thalassotalea mangrovi]TKB43349.1 low molecular weight phosphotyrosine protein phosphatase [Thalassotalea mangrovi]
MNQDSNRKVISSVLFVCMGNICRSPTADAVFRHKAREQGVDIEVDSAGTIAYHQGESPDSRSAAAGRARGYDFSGITARKVVMADFDNFDLILAMDKANLMDLQDMSPDHHLPKVKLFLEYACQFAEMEVPDPYYGGGQGFEHVLDLIEDASEGLLAELRGKVRGGSC